MLVANRFGSVAAAPSAALTAVQVEAWLRLAQSQGALPAEMSVSEPNLSYQRGIQVLEALLRQLRPKTTALLANYPNPFNPETWIPYHLATESDVQITIYDGRGGVVRRLDVGHQPIGSYQSRSRAAYWDGRNDLGESVASGLYFYTLTAGDFTATRKDAHLEVSSGFYPIFLIHQGGAYLRPFCYLKMMGTVVSPSLFVLSAPDLKRPESLYKSRRKFMKKNVCFYFHSNFHFNPKPTHRICPRCFALART